MPRLNVNELEDYLEDREPRREAKKLKKKIADNSNERRPLKQQDDKQQ